MNAVSKRKQSNRTNSEIRTTILEYMYERNARAKSARSDKTGAAVKISVIRRELKSRNGLSQSEIRSNLTYLISQGWIEEQLVQKSFTTPKGGLVPSSTSYFIIAASGIDKIEGPGEFTMDRFHGIKIEATGQNVITIGDGNQVNAKFKSAAEGLAELKEQVRSSEELDAQQKVDIIGDVDSIQSQLGKPSPNVDVVEALWNGIKKTLLVTKLIEKATQVGKLLSVVF